MVYRSLLLFFLLTIFGCGYYSFKGALPPELKTIYIKDFVTTTAFYNIDQNLTNGVTNAFIDDNTLQINNDVDLADLVLKGKVLSVKWENYTVAEGASQSKEDRLTVVLEVECYRKDLKKNLWKKRWDRYAILSSSATQSEIEVALGFIIEELSEDVVLNTVAAW